MKLHCLHSNARSNIKITLSDSPLAPDGIMRHHHDRARGRPFNVAVIPFDNAKNVQLPDDFYAAIAGVKYAE